jgi:arsenate reductase
MSQLTVYQYPKCSTCRNAIKWLTAKGHNLDSRHIVETPPTESELAEMIDNSGLELKKFFNTNGEVYKQLGLKDKLAELSREEQIKLLSSNGMLIKRPLVTDGKTVTLGYKEADYEQIWN